MPVPERRLRFRGSPRRRGTGALLVLNGAAASELRHSERLCGRLGIAPWIVAVDGGLETCRRARRRPELYVGDEDSATPPRGLPAVRFPRDKDFSDLAGGLAELSRRGKSVVVVAGLLGGRLDHEWANLLELASGAPDFHGLAAAGTRGTVLITSHGVQAETTPGETFSLFALPGTASVTLRGAHWQLERRRLRPGSHGLSNRAGRRLELIVHRGTAVLVLDAARR